MCNDTVYVSSNNLHKHVLLLNFKLMIIHYKEKPPINIKEVDSFYKYNSLNKKDNIYEITFETKKCQKNWCFYTEKERDEVYQMILDRYCEKMEVIDRKPFCNECKYFRGLDSKTEEIKCGHESNMVLEDTPLSQTISEWKKCGKELNKDNKCNNFIRA